MGFRVFWVLSVWEWFWVSLGLPFGTATTVIVGFFCVTRWNSTVPDGVWKAQEDGCEFVVFYFSLFDVGSWIPASCELYWRCLGGSEVWLWISVLCSKASFGEMVQIVNCVTYCLDSGSLALLFTACEHSNLDFPS